MSKKEDLQNDLKNSLDDLIKSNLASNDDLLPSSQIIEVQPMNFSAVHDKAKLKAQKTVLSCLKLYFDENLINKNEFIQAKAAIATSNIMTLFKQLKMSEHMMEKLINEIDNGNMQPRMFEVATSVQNTIIEILKNTQLHVISFQEDIKRVKNEMPLSELGQSNKLDITHTQTNTYLNSKNMLKDLEAEDIQDIE